MRMNVKVIERDVLNPLADRDAVKLDITPMPESIGRISLFDNTKPNADLILNIVENKLDNSLLFNHPKKPAGAPATIEQIEEAAESDVSILALGDCGSCTTWVILDALRLEKKGTPTISICSSKFANFAHELAEAHGMSDLRIMEIGHPIAGQSPEQVKMKVEHIIPEIQKMLKI